MSRATIFLSSLAAAFLAIAPQAFDKGDALSALMLTIICR